MYVYIWRILLTKDQAAIRKQYYGTTALLAAMKLIH
jgi:hypothetical protein